jgi:RNA-directed DNA polymerase
VKTEEARPAPTVSQTKQGAEARDYGWVEGSIWTDRMISALVNGVKGGRWFSLIDKVSAPRTLAVAWAKVQANRGASGVDGQSVERFAARQEEYLGELSQALRQGTYQPQAVRRVGDPEEPWREAAVGHPDGQGPHRADGDQAGDRTDLRGDVPGVELRPGRGCQDALREVDRLLGEGHVFVVDADLRSYFDSIPHDRLMERVEARISDGRLLELLRGYLAQDIFDGMQHWTPAGGTPQGAVISPLLGNLYLHAFIWRRKAIAWCGTPTTSS